MLTFLVFLAIFAVARVAWVLLTPSWVRTVVAGWMPAVPLIATFLVAGLGFLFAGVGDIYKVRGASTWGRRIAWSSLGFGAGTWLADGALFVMQMMGATTTKTTAVATTATTAVATK